MAHGIMNGAIQHLKLPPLLIDRTFTENLKVYGSKAAGYVGAKAIFYGSDAFKDLHKEVAQVVIQSFCADLCKSIGAAYKSVDALGNIVDGKLDYFSHKLMHGFVGALGGAVHGVDGMAAGATGAAFGEVIGEMVLSNPAILQKMRDLHQQGVDQATILREHVDVKAFLVKLTAAVGSGLFGLDTQIAYDGADRAIENNCTAILRSVLAFGKVANVGKWIRVFDKNGKLIYVLYNASEDGQNKAQEQQAGENQKQGTGGSGGSGGEDPNPKDPKKPDGKFKTPEPEHENIFDKKRLPGKAQLNKLDGSVWEKDTTSHGGKQYKRWDSIRSWKKDETPNSIWPDGRVRK